MGNLKSLVTVRVLFFGAAREAAGVGEAEVDLPAPLIAGDALAQLVARFPALAKFGRSLLLAVNEEYPDAAQTIRAGDELAVFPPVSGGGHDFFELTTEPLDVGAVARRVVLPECGATVTLDGYVREWTRGRRTLYLVYEAYEPMARREMQRLGAQAHEQFEIASIGIVHRLGRLEIGATSVVVSVAAPHRRAAFAAAEWAIKELKRTVPIWKKEFYEGGEVWVEGENP
jgi:molybdopterin synthase catalytic subunit